MQWFQVTFQKGGRANVYAPDIKEARKRMAGRGVILKIVPLNQKIIKTELIE